MIIYDKWGGENLETCLELEQYRGSNQMAEVRRPYEIYLRTHLVDMREAIRVSREIELLWK